MKAIQFLVSVCLIILPTVSQAWWSDEWQFRKKITLDTTAASGVEVKGSVAEVPVLIRLHTGNFGFFLDLKPDAGDLRFIAADDKTPLKHHVEKFDPINEMALIWVKLPLVNGESNTNAIWMYYGNATAATGDDAAGTFDVNQSLVLHFSEKDNIPHDVTAYGNNPVMSTVEYSNASIVGSGAQFKGNSIIKAPLSPALEINPEKGWSFTSWIKISAEQSRAFLLHQVDGSNSLSIVLDGTSVFVEGKSGGVNFSSQKTASLVSGTWHNLAVTIGGGRISVFVDGLEQSSTPVLFAPIGGSPVIGAQLTGANYFSGELDEVNISSIARGADYISLLAKSQAPQSTMIKLGQDEQKDAAGEGGVSYFGIILQSVTFDGWVVIVLLIIMAVISWIVMIGKGMVVSRAQKDNTAFIESYKSAASYDPASLDHTETEDEKALGTSPLAEALFGKHDHFQSSPLYHIYHAGIQEVNSRIGRSAGAHASGLSSQSIDAIRSTLHSSLIRETQRLNKQMVLLTIAISGGPFLGLLGTVVGVMITFAAIAAAGDVNVNAIAPGIAAALVATVAGLVVAIPALFGYNYIGSRIKEINADMHVFVDEFVSKIAEHYGRG